MLSARVLTGAGHLPSAFASALERPSKPSGHRKVTRCLRQAAFPRPKCPWRPVTPDIVVLCISLIIW